jgi:uncharacterized protein YciI
MKRLIGLAAVVFAALVSAPACAATSAMPQWLIVLSLARAELQDPKAWTATDNAAVGAHFNRLKTMTAEGKVILFGRTQDTMPNGDLVPDTMGLVILEAPDRAAAEAVLNDDPAVKAGLMKGKVFSYQVALQRK